MFKKSGLSFKLGFGFGVVTMITVLLGVVALRNMHGVKVSSMILINENIPEVEIASNIERSILNTVYAMRGYTLTYDKKYLEVCNSNLNQAKQYLKEALAHSTKYAHLTQLKETGERAQKAVAEYEKMVAEMSSNINTMQRTLDELIPLGDKFNENCNLLLERQIKLLESDANNIKNVSGVGIKNSLKQILLLNECLSIMIQARKDIWQALELRDMSYMERAQTFLIGIQSKLKKIKKLESDLTVIKNVDAINDAKDAYISALDVLAVTFSKIEELILSCEKQADIVVELAKKSAVLGMNDTVASSKFSSQVLSRASSITVFGLIIGLLLAVFLAVTITRGITVPVKRIIETLSAGSAQVTSAANHVSASSQQLSQGATEQASSLEETSSSLEEMNTMTKQNAESASRASQLAQESRKMAETGSEAMKGMQAAMGAINDSSDKISRIIKTIEEIAFQTNLLALNAAVEAARAGEHGKGFAVVAEEVRNLAKRSAEAAKDTANLIEDNIIKAKDGSDIAKKAGESLNGIIEQGKKVADIVMEIAAASKEQAAGIDQITKAIAQMDQVTQQNAASAEESASASEELSSQAEMVNGAVVELNTLVKGSGNEIQLASGSERILHERRGRSVTGSPSNEKALSDESSSA